MTTWLIHPTDPLIVRDGRPFGPNPGARATTLPFPYPSTLVGAVRTRAGMDSNGKFDETKIKTVKEVGIRGPLLAELDDTGQASEQGLLAPAPADALLLPGTDPETADRIHLLPLALPQGGHAKLPEGLALVGQARPRMDKPLAAAPRFWYWPEMAKWLLQEESDTVALKTLGIAGLATSVRMHPQIDRKAQIASEGMLFQTSGLEFTRAHSSGSGWSDLALVVEEEKNATPTTAPRYTPLGGERRFALWRNVKLAIPECPDAIRQAIRKSRHCRLILLTPALFNNGFVPGARLTGASQSHATIVAAAVAKPQVISGWDMKVGAPKPTRRLAPAGSVYFLKLKDGTDVDAFIDCVWMQNVSDGRLHRLDGFGLAVLGVWDGKQHTMEVK